MAFPGKDNSLKPSLCTVEYSYLLALVVPISLKLETHETG